MKLIIKPDEHAESPTEWADLNLFLIANHRQFYVQVPGQKGTLDVQAEIDARDSGTATHHVFMLEAYIHSGVRLALRNEGNFCDRQWDVSLVGAVFASVAEWPEHDAARKAVLQLIATWNQYLSGDVWGCVIEDDNGNVIDSCWGFYGHEYAQGEGERMLKHAIENGFDPVI